MSNHASNNNTRIAKNTLLLYFRMILLMAISLYTSRVVLSTLGIEDYGIYNVVGGFVGMFAFLNGAMSGCTLRFITIALGKGDVENLKKVFSTCVITHGMIALLVLIFAETVGLWFVLKELVIPAGRMAAAMIVYQCSVACAMVMIMSFPYNADIIAHERMSAFAYISIIEAIANLGIVCILHFALMDKLALYSILLLCVKVFVIFTYRIYCRRHFIESKFQWLFDQSLLKEMSAFTGWNLWGGIAGTMMGQGINILLNIFFGPAINAARGMAVHVQSAVQLFATNFQTALNPQMMKTYATGDLNSMHTLVFRSAKFTFMLLLCIILPLMLQIDLVLELWLKEVPTYTNIFVCLMLCISVVDAVSNPFMTASAATGKVKIYQSVVGGILLTIVPIAYLALRLGAEPYSVFIVHLCIALVAFTARLLIIRTLINLSIREYVAKVIMPCIYVAITSITVSLFIKLMMPNGLIYAILTILFSGCSIIFFSMLFGLSANERKFVLSKLYIYSNKR